MAINWLEVQPHPNAVKSQLGWVDKDTGEILVSAYGYFKPPYDLKQEEFKPEEKKIEPVSEIVTVNQEVTYTPIQSIEIDAITLDTPTKWKMIKIGKLNNPLETPVSLGFDDIETDNFTIRLSGKNNYPQGESDVAVYIKRTENAPDEFLIAEELSVYLDEVAYKTELMTTINKG